MEILAFLGITVSLIASVVTIIVGFFQISAMVHKQRHRKAIEKNPTNIVKKGVSKAAQTTRPVR